jgi:hypothetical protein
MDHDDLQPAGRGGRHDVDQFAHDLAADRSDSESERA